MRASLSYNSTFERRVETQRALGPYCPPSSVGTAFGPHIGQARSRYATGAPRPRATSQAAREKAEAQPVAGLDHRKRAAQADRP